MGEGGGQKSASFVGTKHMDWFDDILAILSRPYPISAMHVYTQRETKPEHKGSTLSTLHPTCVNGRTSYLALVEISKPPVYRSAVGAFFSPRYLRLTPLGRSVVVDR